MTTFDPGKFGENLREAMQPDPDRDFTGMDVKALQLALRKRTDARGTSYGSVWSYVNGEAPLEPRREVVGALASVLRVREGWLLGDGGAMTETEERARQRSRTTAAGAGRDESVVNADPAAIQRAFVEALPALGSVGASATTWSAIADLHAALWSARQRKSIPAALRGMKSKGIKARREAMRQLDAGLAREAAQIVGAAARAAGVQLETLTYWQLDRYVQLTVQAVAVLLARPRDIARGGN